MILDASVWLAAEDPDEEFFESARNLVLSGQGLTALDLTVYEVINVLAKKHGDPAAAIRLSSLVLEASGPALIRVDPATVGPMSSVVTNSGLSAYDAAYVAAAKREQTDLVSVDMRHLVRPGHAITPDQALERL